MRENTNDLNQSTPGRGEGLGGSFSGRVPASSSEDEENRLHSQAPSDEIVIGNVDMPHDENESQHRNNIESNDIRRCSNHLFLSFIEMREERRNGRLENHMTGPTW